MNGQKITVKEEVPNKHALLPEKMIFGPNLLSDPLKKATIQAIRTKVKRGGKLLILEQSRWLYPDWIDVEIERMPKGGAGAVFWWEKSKIPATIKRGLTDRDLYRFNGHPGDLMTHRLTPLSDSSGIYSIGQDGWKRLWGSTAIYEKKIGKGSVIFCQLSLTKRLDPKDKENYDPTAETVLVNLIQYLNHPSRNVTAGRPPN